jgi:hypothetical protein
LRSSALLAIAILSCFFSASRAEESRPTAAVVGSEKLGARQIPGLLAALAAPALARAIGGAGALTITPIQDSLSGPACYKHKFSGMYKTFRPGDVQAPTIDWCFIHNGDCQCEGQTGDVCQEPGDTGQC